MACLTEAMGLSLPGSLARAPCGRARKIRLAKLSGMKIMELVEKGINRPPDSHRCLFWITPSGWTWPLEVRRTQFCT